MTDHTVADHAVADHRVADHAVTDRTFAERAEALRDRYRTTLGAVPGPVEDRLRVAQAYGRLATEEAFTALRHLVLADSPLGGRVQQLVHFGQLLALGRAEPARIHARGARHAGAGIADLIGVAETALITSGTPAYALGIEIIVELLQDDDKSG
ncbi:alkylhydroperoxidase/carboxymuconolactone decarboxylase family protein YurZ [Streptomyces sp. 1114.5]|uniref:carboxymuconolactone decarboxylase family protein n=1 Tax=Streptomyces sp. 1114.5 TaxID=1938830 RepID=UPI000EABC8D8|nr:carboxymuconolactone decarboxylase family protein [Streptomyces sp. 1114.5]RKT16955.1 alkylhydroperoxidase/carboxymuconolactone decarboxylase family protein YurZ [Streptomyces sp. 1114.5]